jgi:hypothetical protein
MLHSSHIATPSINRPSSYAALLRCSGPHVPEARLRPSASHALHLKQPGVNSWNDYTTRFGASFNYLTERRMSRLELARFANQLKAKEPMVRSIYPSPDLGSGYVRSKQYVVLDTWDLTDDWVRNRQAGHRLRKRVSPWMQAFGLHDEDKTVYDEQFEADFAPERAVFQTSNISRWSTILNWLRFVDPDRASYIQNTRDWKVVYPPAIWAMLLRLRQSSRLPDTAD